VDQKKIKRQSTNFSIPKHLDLSYIIIPFPWMLLEIKFQKRGNQSTQWVS